MDIDREERNSGLVDVEVDVSLVKGKSEVGDEETDFRLVKVENDEKNADNHRISPENGLSDVKIGVFDFREDEYEPKASVGTSSDALETKSGVLELDSARSSAPVYQSLMSEFDEFVANEKFSQNGTSRALRYGLELGDMVWGKVKSHPWWPGHIFNEALASTSVRRVRGDGSVLVAFFGDSSYGWFDPAELIPFDANFAEKSKQTTSKSFVKAVEEAIDETSRRSALGLVCKCRSKFNFRPANVQGYYSVDVPDYELGGFYSAAIIKKSRDSFVPSETLSFIQKLAAAPQSSDETDIGFIKHRAVSFAYRRAVFEEFDETYAQAFGAPAVITSHDNSGATDQPIKVPTRAPLSGPLVIAEALGGVKKTPSKPMKVKDHSKKDKYLFKRRDEPNTASPVPAPYVQSSSVAAATGGFVLQKRPPSLPLSPGTPTTSGQDALTVLDSDSPSKGSKEKLGVNEATLDSPSTTTKVLIEKIGSFLGSKEKIGVNEVTLDSPSTTSKVLIEKIGSFQGSKEKLGVNEATLDSSSTTAKVPKEKIGSFQGNKEKLGVKEATLGIDRVEDGNGDRVMVKKKKKVAKQPVKALGLDPLTGEKKKKKRKEVVLEAGAENPPRKKLATGKTRPAMSAQLDPASKTDSGSKKDDVSVSNIELPQLLSGLQSLALDHFHAPEKISSAVVRQSFLRFRSIVYQKSLSGEQDSTVDATSAKPLSAKRVPVDKKRAPSDRQEEIGAKRVKNMNKIKSLSDKKPATVKKLPPPQQEKTVKKSPPQQHPPKKVAAVPTMLVMKFPPKISLPSVAELKARFARFGPLDYSGVRVFWKSSTCRVVFQYKPDAVSAYKYAVGNSNLFGNVDVRYFVREVEEMVEPPLSEFYRPSPVQPPVQLKSILKKPGEDTGPSKARVKFVLGGEDSPNPNQNPNQNTNLNPNQNTNSSFADVASSSSTNTGPGLVVNSKNFQKSTTTTATTVLPSLLPLPPKYPSSGPHQTPSRDPPVVGPVTSRAGVDISQQMISLLNRCNEVVANLTGALGYVPYHPL